MKCLVAGSALLLAGGVAAVLLNIQGASCLTQLARVDRSAFPPDVLEQMEQDCFIITNSYVYSLFAAVAGAVVLGYWYFRRRKA
ncbi:hypothetical protein [Nitrososphaera sp.]|uniref:hypothetical protein n=1 Tax=Nitrososphaera sp. TaxID=1971748 RepID=UPI00317AF425